MTRQVRTFTCTALLALAVILGTPSSFGWDDTGHRLMADLSFDQLAPPQRIELLELLSRHPRFQEDFLAAMPPHLRGEARERWLWGRAAFWPDVTRGLPDAEAARYNRPNWHYIDGDLVGRSATLQGNVYLGMAPLRPRQLFSAGSIRDERRAAHVISALDYNSRLFTNPDTDPGARAIALCWLLHLTGDIHQPLHTGALYLPRLHPRGDRGGNATPTDDGNLHARWDQALSSLAYDDALAGVRAAALRQEQTASASVANDWPQWMQESRELLQGESVYNTALRDAAVAAAANGSAPAPVTLAADYRRNMARIATERLALAGLRMAAWLNRNLP